MEEVEVQANAMPAYGKRKAIKWRCLGCVLGLLFFAALSCTQKPEISVLLITLDTTRADHLSCYGYSRQTTPALDRLSTEGILFTNAYCTSPSTLPSHISILTGLHPLSFGVHDNNTRVPDEAHSIAEVLARHGYETAAFVSSFVLSELTNVSQGFQLYDSVDDFMTDTVDQAVNAIPGYRSAEETTQQALSWWQERRRGKPFFAWVHYYDPHFPYRPPSEFDHFSSSQFQNEDVILYDLIESGSADIRTVFTSAKDILSATEYQRLVDLYDGEIARMDASIDNLLKAVSSSDEKTLIIVVADHGESFGEKGLSFCHELLDDPCVRIPMILSLDGVCPKNVRASTLVSAVDLFPTILSILNIRTEKRSQQICQGVDLSPYWTGEKQPDRDGVFAEDGKGRYMVRDDTFKAIVSKDKSEISLFDMLQDPSESNCVALDRQDIVRDMLERVDRWFSECIVDSLQATQMIPDQERMEALQSLGYTGGQRHSR